MPLPISPSLISAQAQSYVAPREARPYAPPQVEKLAARGSNNAVQVEISAEARKAEQSRFEARAVETKRDDKRVDDKRADARRDAQENQARDFAREAPLRGFEGRDAQQNAGTRNTRPGTTLDIRI